MRPARIICVGTGRDGTLSVTQMIQDIFDRTEGRYGRHTFHEYGARELYNAFAGYKETGEEKFVEEIRRIIRECPFDCIVGNGYAAVLPFFREQWGPDTRLIHLRRRDRDACIASYAKNAELFPEANGYYATVEGARVKRMAAFHFGEMNREEWERIPIAAKFAWYYDKTHALIDQHKALFGSAIEIATEDLSAEPTRRAIARLVTGADSVVPPASHVHSYTFDIASFPEDIRGKAMWLIGQTDWDRLVGDDAYAVIYFLRKFIEWQDPQSRGAAAPGMQRSRDDVAATLSQVRAKLTEAIERIDAIARVNSGRAE